MARNVHALGRDIRILIARGGLAFSRDIISAGTITFSKSGCSICVCVYE